MQKWELRPCEKKKLLPEQIVRAEVIGYLRERGHWVLPHKTEASFKPGIGYLAFNSNYGTVGEADLLCFSCKCPAFPLWLELKKKGKRCLDKDQIIFKQRALDHGHEYHVIQDWRDCKEIGL